MIAPSVMAPWILMTALKASILLGAAFVVTALMRRASAASRHVLWLAAFGAVLALPIAVAVLPSFGVPVLAPAGDAAAPQLAPTAITITGAPSGGVSFTLAPSAIPAKRLKARATTIQADRLTLAYSPEMAPPAPPAGAGPVPSTWPLRVFLLWMFGFVMVAVAFAVGVLRTHLVACAALPVRGDDLAEEVEILSASLGIVRDVRVVTWAGPAMPMTWGALRPVVLLPEEARTWPSARRREVLTHELAHVRRGDWIARLIAAFACALYWFNPLVWMAASRMRNEQELACDDTVLAGGVVPSDYASHLLDVARALRVPSFAMANASVAMARPSQLTGRLLAVLDESRARVASAPGRTVGLTLLCAVALLATVGAATPVARTDRGYAVVAQASPPAPPFAAPPGPPSPPVAAAAPVSDVVMGEPDCWDRSSRESASGRGRGRGTSTRSSSSHSHSNSNVNDDGSPSRVSLSLSDGGCALEVRMVGAVRFNDDESDVVSVSRDGSFRITEEGNGPERQLDITWRNGQRERRWRVDGENVAESAALRAWLATALQIILSRTGYDVVPRTMRAYRAGGLDSALKLADATGSDYARRQMLMALLDSVRVPAAEAARIARQALTMSSDYERAELLIAVAQRLQLDGAVQDAMVSATGSMSSDYERRRVLSAALARREISSQSAQELIRVAGTMSSDYEKAELLIGFIQGRGLTPSMQVGILGATASISSDYEHRRVLDLVVDRPDAPPEIAQEVCIQALRLGSDYERAELLLKVARRFGGSADVRSRIRRATEGMSSDYERDRVLAALGRMSQ